MTFEQLRKLSERNEIRIDDNRNFKRTPPHYYDSLRHAFEFYFNTFITQNHLYDFYAHGLLQHKTVMSKRQYLDDENTMLSITSFSRYFELFIKDLLHRVNPKLNYIPQKPLSKANSIQDLISRIEGRTFVPKKFDKKNLSIPFREAINRFYGFVGLSKQGSSTRLVKKFAKVFKSYAFLDSSDFKGSLQLLNWYRDRMLHNGNSLPSLWLLDFFVTQRIVPIVADIVAVEQSRLGYSLFYLETVTKINLLEKLKGVQFPFSQLKNPKKVRETFIDLMYIGHLKELGRANFNMNLFVRSNQATFEYNYKDPKGRGRRMAEIEIEKYPDAKEIKKCPCCGEESMVLYSISTLDIFNVTKNKEIEWVKCYTCGYHIRDNAGDPFYLELSAIPIFKPNRAE